MDSNVSLTHTTRDHSLTNSTVGLTYKESQEFINCDKILHYLT